jgi:PTS system N-acetylglucosamine-specific IIC component
MLTGFAFMIMKALGVRLGFGFSAGLFDYVLNYKFATRPLLLLPIGALYFGIYYGVFRFAIVKFDLKTPGRESAEAATPAAAAGAADRAQSFITALGGAGNLESVAACTTRLRLIVRTQATVDAGALKRLGAMGIVRPSATALQVVMGPVADQLAGEIREALAALPPGNGSTPPAPALAVAARGTAGDVDAAGVADTALEVPPLERPVVQKLFEALGGSANVRSIERASSRLRVGVASPARVDSAAIRTLGLRGVTVATDDCVHVIVGPAAQSTCASLRELLAS